jgi:hypothetical protein
MSSNLNSVLFEYLIASISIILPNLLLLFIISLKININRIFSSNNSILFQSILLLLVLYGYNCIIDLLPFNIKYSQSQDMTIVRFIFTSPFVELFSIITSLLLSILIFYRNT